jgi:hypothetical protein
VHEAAIEGGVVADDTDACALETRRSQKKIRTETDHLNP